MPACRGPIKIVMKVSLVDLKTNNLSIIIIDVLNVCIEIQVNTSTILGIWIWGNFYVLFQEIEVLCVGSCFHYFCRILEPDLVVVYTCIVVVVCGTMLGFGF
jgi:hypothetical protein